MGYTITGLADFLKSEGKVIITDLITAGDAFNQDGFGVQTGIKSSEKLLDLSVEGNTFIQATAGDPGALTRSGGTTMLDVNISVTELAVVERYRRNILNDKITQMQMRAGSDPGSEMPYSDIIMGLKGPEIKRLNQLLLWQGATGGTQNLKHFNGVKAQVAAGSPVTGGTAAQLSADTAIDTFDSVRNIAIAAYPAWETGCYAWMSPRNFSVLYRDVYGLSGVIDANTLNSNMRLPNQFIFPGTNCVVYNEQGLTGVNNIYITRQGNFVAGTDLESETDEVTLEYQSYDMSWHLNVIYKLGVKVARIGEVVATL